MKLLRNAIGGTLFVAVVLLSSAASADMITVANDGFDLYQDPWVDPLPEGYTRTGENNELLLPVPEWTDAGWASADSAQGSDHRQTASRAEVWAGGNLTQVLDVAVVVGNTYTLEALGANVFNANLDWSGGFYAHNTTVKIELRTTNGDLIAADTVTDLASSGDQNNITWVSLSAVGTAQAGASGNLAIYLYGDPAADHQQVNGYDTVSLSYVPEPATMGLMMFGSAALLARRGRQRA